MKTTLRDGLLVWPLVLMLPLGACDARGGDAASAPAPQAQAAPQGVPQAAEQVAEQAAAPARPPHHPYGHLEVIPKPAKALRVVSFNVENLFDDVDDPALSGSNDDKDETKPLPDREALAKAIRAIDADVIALQELESEAALKWFRDTHLSGLGYEHLASIDAGDARGIEQGVLSRFPIDKVQNWPGKELGGVQPEMEGNRPNPLAGQPLKFHRSPLRVDLKIPGATVGMSEPYALTLLVVHCKSGRWSGYWREAEAAGAAALIKEWLAASPQMNLMVLGDFNAQDQDQSVQTFLSAGLTDVMSLGEDAKPAQRDGAEALEWITHASGRRIDKILASPGLLSDVSLKTRFVYSTPQRDPSEDYRTTPTPPGYSSDHMPVVVDLLGDQKGSTAAP